MDDESSWIYWYKYIYYPTYNRLDGLIVGVSIAGVYQFLPLLWNKITKYGNLFIGMSLLILTGAYFLCEDQITLNASIYGFPLIAVGYGFLVLGAICPSSFLYQWKSKITTLIATLSFGIYLIHKGIIHLTHEVFMSLKIDANLFLLISIMASFAFAYLLHIVVERPFMKIRNKVINKL